MDHLLPKMKVRFMTTTVNTLSSYSLPVIPISNKISGDSSLEVAQWLNILSDRTVLSSNIVGLSIPSLYVGTFTTNYVSVVSWMCPVRCEGAKETDIVHSGLWISKVKVLWAPRQHNESLVTWYRKLPYRVGLVSFAYEHTMLGRYLCIIRKTERLKRHLRKTDFLISQ